MPLWLDGIRASFPFFGIDVMAPEDRISGWIPQLLTPESTAKMSFADVSGHICRCSDLMPVRSAAFFDTPSIVQLAFWRCVEQQ